MPGKAQTVKGHRLGTGPEKRSRPGRPKRIDVQVAVPLPHSHGIACSTEYGALSTIHAWRSLAEFIAVTAPGGKPSPNRRLLGFWAGGACMESSGRRWPFGRTS